MDWLKRILGAVGLSLFWGAAWAAVGGLIRIADPRGSLDGFWLGPAIGIQPGLLGGVIFAALLGIAVGGRRLDEQSLPKVIACGGLAGFLVGALPFAINQPANEAPLWLVGVVVLGSMTLLGAVSAAASWTIARWASALRGDRRQHSW